MLEDANTESQWAEVREQLTPTDTDEATDQLAVMNKARVVYDDGVNSNWEEEIAERYELLVEAFGGEEEVQQYHDIGGLGVTVVAERDDSPVFVVYADESHDAKYSGPLSGLASTV